MRFRCRLYREKQTRAARGFTLVELMIVVAILGILAAIAVPTLTKYLRKSRTSEARANLAKIFDATVAHFHGAHVDRGEADPLQTGGQIGVFAPHRCPHQVGQETGQSNSGTTPGVATVNCNDGPSARCVPAVNPAGPGYYSIDAWSGNPSWNALNFGMEQSHYFHYSFRASNTGVGYGACQFTAQAFADLDNDLTFSTFERQGAADQQGVNASAGLYMHNEVE